MRVGEVHRVLLLVNLLLLPLLLLLLLLLLPVVNAGRGGVEHRLLWPGTGLH